MANKWVYLFSEGNASMRELLGGEPGGDDEPWAACAAGIYDYDGGLHAVL